MSKGTPELRARVTEDRIQSLEDLETFGRLADQTAEAGGVIAFEWPTGIEGWALEQLVAIIDRHKLVKVHFHGCMLGLVTPEGVPMRKAWTVATNCEELRATLAAARCNGKHSHQKKEGKPTELSGLHRGIVGGNLGSPTYPQVEIK